MRRVAWALFALLFAAQVWMAAQLPPRNVVGDEPYYVDKAYYIFRHGIPPNSRLIVDWIGIEEGDAWGNSDWRPQGYPALLALTLLGEGPATVADMRIRAAALHFALLGIAMMMLLALLRDAPPRTQLLAALVLGIAPWPYAFVTMIGPDSPNASLAFIGLALLHRRRYLGGSLLLGFTLLLRPEMLAIAPCALAVALVLHRANRRAWVLAGAAFLLMLSVQIAYRAYFIRAVPSSIYAPLRIYNAGAFAWVHTWIGSEHQAYDFVYALGHGDTADMKMPARAFANDEERRLVDSLRARVQRQGFNRDVDRALGALAERRRRADPIGANLLPRLWHGVHLWVNFESNEQLLHALAGVPRAIRRPIYGALFALKLALLAAFAWRLVENTHSCLFAVKRTWTGRSVCPPFLIFAAFVVGRTLLMGVILNWMAHRYALTAWLPLLATVFLGNTHAAQVAREDT